MVRPVWLLALALVAVSADAGAVPAAKDVSAAADAPTAVGDAPPSRSPSAPTAQEAPSESTPSSDEDGGDGDAPTRDAEPPAGAETPQDDANPSAWEILGRTHVEFHDVIASGQAATGLARDIGLGVGGGFRYTWGLAPGLSLGGELGYNLMLAGITTPDVMVGSDLGVVMGLGADGAGLRTLPVGLVLSGGLRTDLRRITSTGRWLTGVRPFAAGEAIVSWLGFTAGVRGEIGGDAWMLRRGAPGLGQRLTLGIVVGSRR